MSRTLSLCALGCVSAALMLAVPEKSQAQGFGISLNLGRGGFSYSDPGYYYDGYRYPYTGPAFNLHYNSGYSPYRDHAYRGSSYSPSSYSPSLHSQRSVIVHPETYYWSPRSGYHSHGHIHVPTRHGYRTIPY